MKKNLIIVIAIVIVIIIAMAIVNNNEGHWTTAQYSGLGVVDKYDATTLVTVTIEGEDYSFFYTGTPSAQLGDTVLVKINDNNEIIDCKF